MQGVGLNDCIAGKRPSPGTRRSAWGKSQAQLTQLLIAQIRDGCPFGQPSAVIPADEALLSWEASLGSIVHLRHPLKCF
eukprot:3655782-Amphidinium_carterae.1